MPETRYIDRPPRIQPELPQGVVEVPAPPSKELQSSSLIQLALPMVTIIGYLLISVFGRGRSLWLMIPMGLSVVASVSYSIYSSRNEKKRLAEIEAAYTERLIELRQQMMQEHDMQRRFYFHNYPEPITMLRIAEDANQVSLHPSTHTHLAMRLWERRTTDTDFGSVRLGKGTLPSTVKYELADGGDIEDPQMRDAVRLVQDSLYVDNVPILLLLRQLPSRPGQEDSSSTRHAVGIAGGNLAGVYALVRSLMMDFSVFQAPTDARLFVLGLEESRSEWVWASSLPHIGGEDAGVAMYFEDEADRAAEKEASKVDQFLKSFRRLLDDRKMRLLDRDSNVDVTHPFVLLVVDLLASPPNDSRLKDLETDPGISLLINEGPQLGAAIIFLVSQPSKVPSGCLVIVDVTTHKPQIDVDIEERPTVAFRYAEVGLNTPRYLGEANILAQRQRLDSFATALAPLAVRKSYGADLPRTVHMLDMLKVKTIEDLRVLTRENWRTSQRPERADWLRVTLGMLSGGDFRTLKFSADADGVHGLIAGSTGSGKSELLMTMILGLAANYDPSIVNFVLVDFKGGGAFKPLENLPHVVDVVTNLGESAVERMFAAITAELNRRQNINTTTESKHIVDYRKRGLHLPYENSARYGKPVQIKDNALYTAPYPHLFVFIDEFAEMIAANPEYKAQLNSITRLGRALGVTLILAAQRPSGVTDQMRANIKFRIALRVETREESSEVLRRPDAAYLPTGIPGRGYLQVGNENIELIQVAWTGAEYDVGSADSNPDVIWLDRPSRADSTRRDDDELPTVYDEMVKMMADLADEAAIPQSKPWPDFLPENMSLQTPFDAAYLEDEMEFVEFVSADNTDRKQAILNVAVSRWLSGELTGWSAVEWNNQTMRPVVGLVDNPYQSEQRPLVVDFRRGHAVIFGASGWGKTVFLRTVLTSLAATHSPEAFHAYVLDFGGRQMNLFRNLPHVGAVITADEDERVQRLLRKLDSTLEQRKKVVTEQGEDNLYNFNRRFPGQALPAILVIIDNFAEFKESYEGLLPLLISIVRESRAWGVHFMVSAELPSALSGKLYSLLTERMALKLSDQTEYSGIVGRGTYVLEDVPGRGFVQVARRALEFQTALPVGEQSEIEGDQETQQLVTLIGIMHKHAATMSPDKRAAQIETLPENISLREILPNRPQLNRLTPHIRPIVGIDDLNLEPWALDLFSHGPHCMIIGPPNTGKTSFMRTLVLSLAHSYTPDEAMLVLVDFQQRLFRYGGELSLADLPHVSETLANSDHITQFVERLQLECRQIEQGNIRRRPIFVIVDNYESFSDDLREKRTILPQLAVLAREYGTSGLHFVIGGSPEITRSPDELRKQIHVPRFGVALDAESVSRLNGRVPRALTLEELPIGRGFVIKSGRTLMVQVATPYSETISDEANLDEFVRKIRAHFKGMTATWQYRAPEDTVTTSNRRPPETMQEQSSVAHSKPIESSSNDVTPMEEDEETTDVYIPLFTMPPGVDVAALRKQLEQLTKMSFDWLMPIDIVNIAREKGLWKPDTAESEED